MSTVYVPSKWYWQHPQETWDYSEDFGPLIPPFDAMWVQWRRPPMVVSDGERQMSACEDHVAYFKTTHTDDGPIVEAGIWVSVDGRTVIGYDSLCRFFLTPEGSIQQIPEGHRVIIDMGPAHLAAARSFYGDPHEAAHNFRGTFAVAFLAISLMHCKNVPVTEQSNMANPRSRKKYRIPERTVTVVKVPAALRSGSGSRREAVGAVQPLHLVRGHFKTYTEDAPLFGKHTGTYWWGWQARGTEEAGRRDHVYEVAEP